MHTNKLTAMFALAVVYTYSHYVVITSVFEIKSLEDAKKTFEILGVLITMLSVILAVRTFKENSRQKAAELLLSLEETFREKIHQTLLRIEYEKTYQPIDDQLEIALGRGQFPTLPEAIEEHLSVVKDVDAVFRFFHLCIAVRKLDVDQNSLDQLLNYWICVLNQTEKEFMRAKTDDRQGEQNRREHLNEYMRTFWPVVDKRAQEIMESVRAKRKRALVGDDTRPL